MAEKLVYSETVTRKDTAVRYVTNVFWFSSAEMWAWEVRRIYGDQDIRIAENGDGKNLERCKAEAREALDVFWGLVRDAPAESAA